MYTYQYAYTDKITGEACEIHAEGMWEEMAREKAYNLVFSRMEEDELEFVGSDEPDAYEEPDHELHEKLDPRFV